MEKELMDLAQWCVDKSKDVSIDVHARYSIQLNAAEQAKVAEAIYAAIGAAFTRIGKLQ